MFTFQKIIFTVGALVLGAVNSVRAHAVWIEPGDGQLAVRFAEPGSAFEKSPGYLDGLSVPVAFVLATNAPKAVEAVKRSDHFQLVGASPAHPAGAETSFTVRAGRKPIFYARWQPPGAGPAEPLLTLDLVPTGAKGEVRAYFRGRPLGGAKATLRTPDGKTSALTADAEGFLRFSSGQAGRHLLTMAHQREPLAGFHLGIAYAETSHNCSLVWWETK